MIQLQKRSTYLLGAVACIFLFFTIHQFHADDKLEPIALGRIGPFGTKHASDLLRFEAISQDALPLLNHAWTLLENRTVVARVFYGRRDRIEILECYLRRNLKYNGGLLDQVDFVYQTEPGSGQVHRDDMDYLVDLVRAEPGYTSTETHGGFGHRYDNCIENVIYFKIDDDIVYIEDAAIPSMVISLFENPEYPIIGANVVRHALLSHVHARNGAIKPIQLVHDHGVSNNDDWKMSNVTAGSYPEDEENYQESQIPLPEYSWLPIRSGTTLKNTPMAKAGYNSYDRCTWSSPYCGLQTHLSFFMRKEEGTLSYFNFGHHWDYSLSSADRASINLIAWKGRDIYAGLPEDGTIPAEDEHWITTQFPKITGNHHVAIGAALVSHLSYGQHWGFNAPDWTLVLAKYKSLARDTCPLLREWTTEHWKTRPLEVEVVPPPAPPQEAAAVEKLDFELPSPPSSPPAPGVQQVDPVSGESERVRIVPVTKDG